MANVFPRARLRLIWIGWKSAARRGKPRQSMNHRAPGAVGISCFLTPSVRAVPYGPNASVANGGAALTSNPKNDCNNKPAPIIKPRLDNRAYANASSSNRSEERRVGKSVDLGGRRIIKKKKNREK